jgi:uncharacterized repeat protein (TIGR01451 family)/fimbrial isopeptide formation D2 family protein
MLLLLATSGAWATTTINHQFSPATINPGDTSAYRITITNDDTGSTLSNVRVTVLLQPQITVASPLAITNTCGFTVSQPLGTGGSAIELVGGSIAAGVSGVPSECYFEVNVTSTAPGNWINTIPANPVNPPFPPGTPAIVPNASTPGYLATTTTTGVYVANSTSADATLSVNALSSLTGSKVFSPSPARAGNPVTLTITLGNPNGTSVPITTFTDTLPDDGNGHAMLVNGAPGVSCFGTGAVNGSIAAAGDNKSVTLTGGAIGANGSCVLTVPVVVGTISGTSQTFTNTVAANAVGNSRGLDSAGFSRTLTVNTPIQIQKSFGTNPIPVGQPSLMTLTVTNNGSVNALDIASFSDDLAGTTLKVLNTASLPVAAASNPAVTCTGAGASNGTLATTPDTLDTSITLTGAVAGPGGHCTITAYVTSDIDGNHLNTTSQVSNPVHQFASTPASASLTAKGQLVILKTVSVGSVAPGQWTQFTVTIQNFTGVQIDNVQFKDLLPTAGGNQMVVYDPAGTTSGIYSSTGCTGGTWTGLTAAGADTGSAPVSGIDAGLQWAGGSIAAGVGATPGVCTIYIRAQLPASATSGLTFTNRIPLDSVTAERSDDHVIVSNPDTQPAANVVSVDAVALTKSFSGASIAQGGLSTLTIIVYNRYTSALTGIGFTDTLPAGVVLAANPAPTNNCGGTLQAYPGASQISLTGASLAARPDSSQDTSCSITVKVTGTTLGSFQNIIHPGDFTSSGGTLSANATATLTVTTGITGSKTFSPTAVTPGGTARATITVNNVSNAQLTNLSINDDGFGTGLRVANPANAASSCGGSPTVVANPGAASAQLQGAVLNAGASCTFSFDVTSSSSTSGPWTNTIAAGRITSAEGINNTASISASLLANTASVTINKSFSPVVVTGGQPSVLTIDVVNNSSVAIHDVTFTDTFPPGIQVYAVAGASSTCSGGIVTAVPGDSKIILSGATLAASATCQVHVTTTSVKFLNLTNTIPAGSVSSAEGYTNPLPTSASLSTLQGLGVSKAFAPAYIGAGQTSRLQVTLISTFDPNAVSPTILTGVTLTDTLPSGVSVAATPNATTTCSDGGGGQAAVATGANSLTVTGAVIAPGTSCLVEVDVTAAVVGNYDNTIAKFGVTSTQGVTNQNAATARLSVVTQPTIAKSFAAATVRIGQATRLTVTISNGSGVALSGISLTDTLPAGLAIANTPNAGTSCSNAVIDANAGSNMLAIAGASLATGASCTFYADVVSQTAATYANQIAAGSLTDDQGLSNPGAANATLTVLPPASVSKHFTPVTIAGGGTSTLTITLANSSGSSITLTSDLVDALPGHVVVADTPSVGGTCTGTKTAVAGGSTVSYASGGAIPAGSCTITVDVTSATPGTYVNLIAAGQLQTSAGNNQDPAVAILGVDTAVPPTMDKAFAPATILAGGTSTLTIALHNDNAGALTLAADFTDTLPVGLTVSGSPTTDCGGLVSATPGSITLPVASTIPAGGCSITATITSAAAGSYTNAIATGDLMTDAGSPPLPAVAGLVVNALIPPTLAKTFSPNVINPGTVSTLTLSLGNSNAADITLTGALTDNLPANVLVAAVPNIGGSCSGGVTAIAGAASISYASGATIPPGGCTIRVDVTSSVSGGPWINTIVAGSLQTTAGNNGADATASLFVNPPQPPSISKSFSPTSIPKNGTSTLTLSLGNGNAADTTLSTDLIDTLPTGLVIAALPNVQKTCAGAVTADAGADTITYASGATLPAGGCSINVDVTSATPGTHVNSIATGALSTGQGSNAVGTSASLQVVDWPTSTNLSLTKAITPGSGVAGDTQTVTLTWRNTDTSTPARSMYQCSVADPVPTAAFDETTVTPVSTPAGYTFGRSGSTVTYTRADTTTPCETTIQTASFTIQLKPGVVTGSTYTNTATATARTLPANDPNAAAAATLTRTASADVSVTAASVSAKTATLTSQAFTDSGDAQVNANPPVAIGETITYTIGFALPPGRTNAVILADEITTGIGDVSLVSATLQRSSTGLSAANNPAAINGAVASAPVDVTADVTTSGNEFRLSLGNVDNADLAAATYTLTVTLRIANVATNTAGHVITDQGRLRYQDSASTDYSVVTASRSVHVVLPVVSVSKTALPAAPAGGDTVTYTLVITNTSGSNVTTGFDWTFTDTLPAALTSPGGFTVTNNPNGRTINGSFTGNTLNGTIDQLNAGESVTVTYTATVATGTAFGTTITNSATVRATTIPAGQADEVGERSGSGGVNNLSATTSATVTTSKPSMAKSVVNAKTWYPIGDAVSYRLAVSVPIGSTTNFVINDVLPGGLAYIAGTATVSATAGVTPGVTGAITPTGTASAPVFTLGTITATSAGTVYVDFNARVTNVRTNQHNTGLTNAASATYGSALTIASVNAPQIRVGEPNLTITKSIVSGATGSDAGNTVRWQVVVANAASRVTAYQQTITDTLPNHLNNISVVSVTPSGGNIQDNNTDCTTGTTVSTANAVVSTTTNANDTLTLANLCMASGATLTIVYDSTVMDTAVAGEVLTNTARATYASLPTGSSAAGTARDGADSGTDDDTDPGGTCNGTTNKCNNYNESGSANLTIGALVAIDKQADKTTATLGETVAYTIRVSVNEGVTSNVVVTDSLPAGLTYVAHSINLGNMGITFGNAAYATRLGTGQTVQFNLGNVSNPANASTSDDYVDIVITARVDNIVANQKGTILRNGDGTGAGQTTPTVIVAYGSGTTLGYDFNGTTAGYQGRPLTITEPALTISKTAAPIAQSLGDTVLFTLTLQHDGVNSDATAFDIDVSDQLPAGLTYVTGSASPGEPAVAGNLLTFPTIASLATAAGSTTITYRARVDLGAAVGTTLTNQAAVTWKSQSGATGAANSGRSGPLNGGDTLNNYRAATSAGVTPTASAFIDAQKRVALTVDGGTPGVADPGDTLRYTITLTNQGAVSASNVNFTDAIPLDTTYAGNLTATQGTTATTGSAAVTGITAAVGTLAAGATATIQFDVTIDAGTPAGTLITNQGQVDSDQTVPTPTDADGDPDNGAQPTVTPVGGSASSSLYASKFVSQQADADLSGTVTAGDTMRYSLQVTNTGGATLTGVALTDAIPAGLTLTGTPSADQGTASGTTTLTWSIGTLNPGQIVQASFDVSIGAFGGPTASFSNQGAVTADGGINTLTDGNGSPADGNQPTLFDAVSGVAAAPRLDVQKRWSLATDSDSNGVASQGDVLRYTIVVTNSGSTAASNVRLTDNAPTCAPTAAPCTSLVAGSATTSAGVVVAEGPPLSVNLGNLAIGQTAVISWLVNADAANGNVVSNQASVTASNATTVLSDDDGIAGNGLNPTLTPLAGAGGGTAVPANLQKAVFATDQAGSFGNNVLIGEVVTWRVSIDVPPGTTTDLALVDTIPADLQLVAGSGRLARSSNAVSAIDNPATINGAAAGAFANLGAALQTTSNPDGTTSLALPFGNVFNSAASAASYTLEYRTQVANAAANIAGRTRSNSASASYRNALDQAAALSPVTATVTVIEPQVSITLANSPASLLTSGGDVAFTATLLNVATEAPAEDVTLSIPLPSQYQSAGSLSLTSTGNCASGVNSQVSGTPPQIDVTISTLPAGCAATLGFAATAGSGLASGSTISTQATTRWTSLPGTVGGERTGSGVAPDSYLAQASAGILVDNITLVKELTSNQSRYAIADEVTFRLRLAVPGNFGPIGNVVLSDLLPAGLVYVDGTVTIPAGMSTTSAPTTFTGTGVTADPLILDFGAVTNTTSSTQEILVDYRTRVANALANQSGQTWPNHATLAFVDPGSGLPVSRDTADVQMTVGEPWLTATLLPVTPVVGLNAGATVTYEYVATNTGTTTMYDLVLSDILPAGLDNVQNLTVAAISNAGRAAPAVAAPAAAPPILSGTGSSAWQSSPFDLPVGASVTIRYTVTIADTAQPGQTLQNTVVGTYTSRTGSDTNERTGSSAGPMQTDDTQLDNYRADAASPTLTVGDPIALTKAFRTAGTGQYPVGAPVAYRLTVALAQGTVGQVTVTDTLPAGLDLVSAHAAAVGNAGITLDGSALPSVQTVGSQTVVTWTLGTVVNPANGNAGDDYITLDIDARVANVAANQAAAILGNNAQLDFTDGGGATVVRDFDADAAATGIQALDLTVVEPVLTLTKSVTPATMALGDTVTFNLLIDHTAASGSDAFDVTVVDVLPLGLSYVAGSASTAPTLATLADGRQQLTFAPGTLTRLTDNQTLTYRAQVGNSAVVGTPLANQATLTWSSVSGATGAANGGRNGSDGLPSIGILNDYAATSTATVTPNTDAIYSTKTVALIDTAGDGIVNAGDTLEYTVVLYNGNQAVTGVVFSDPIPVNATYVAGSLTLNGSTTANTGSASQLRVAVGSLAAGASATITFRVTVNAGVVAGAVISNQGQVDSDQTVPTPTDADGNPDNGAQPTTIDVGLPPVAMLSVVKTVAMTSDIVAPFGSITVGDQVTYTLVISNPGTVPLTNVSLNDAVPAEVAITGTSANANWSVSQVQADIGTLAAGASTTITITGTALAAGTFANQAAVTSTETGTVLSDNDGDTGNGINPTLFTATAENVAALPVLALSKSGRVVQQIQPDGLLHTGDVIEYTLVLTNTGAAPATAVMLSDAIPAGTTYVGATVSRGIILGTSPQFQVNVGTVTPGDTITVILQVRVTATTGAQITNSGSFACAEASCPGTSNPVNLDVVAPNAFNPPLGRKTVTAQGSVLTWRMVWINSNNGSANRIRVVDALASELTYIAGSVNCEVRGTSVAIACNYDADHHQIIFEGVLSADAGLTTEADAANEVVITFVTRLADRTSRIDNTAIANWDQNGNGLVIDDVQAGQLAVEADARYQRPATGVPTLSQWLLLVLALMMAGLGRRQLTRR